MQKIKLGVISDTHGRFDPAILPIFRGVDYIIHAGDIGKIAQDILCAMGQA